MRYCLQVPANRAGHGTFSAAELKILQEAITFIVVAGFSALDLRETLRWNYLVVFGFILGAVSFAFKEW